MIKLSTYTDWKHCITVSCNIPLTSAYIEARLIELNDISNYNTKKFVSTWGEAHLSRVIGWFEQAKQEITS